SPVLDKMPLSELVKKSSGLNFDIAAEEMRRLATTPSKEEWTVLYGLYMQALHGDLPSTDIYPAPTEAVEVARYEAWKGRKGLRREDAKKEYITVATGMIDKYQRKIERTKWNSQVWTVDY
ncbi:hypothetical protein PFISCL1PPCAC_8087, partial [Pristionchus fissidentatus]